MGTSTHLAGGQNVTPHRHIIEHHNFFTQFVVLWGDYHLLIALGITVITLIKNIYVICITFSKCLKSSLYEGYLWWRVFERVRNVSTGAHRLEMSGLIPLLTIIRLLLKNWSSAENGKSTYWTYYQTSDRCPQWDCVLRIDRQQTARQPNFYYGFKSWEIVDEDKGMNLEHLICKPWYSCVGIPQL